MSRLIEDYALLSCMHTAALVHRNGSVDWCCVPRFDDEACFARLLGRREHGYWSVAPAARGLATRRYRGGSLILETDWETTDGACRVIDFMPTEHPVPSIVRIVEGLSGRVAVRSELLIRFGYGREAPKVTRDGDRIVATAGRHTLGLWTPVATSDERAGLVSTFAVGPGERLPFVLVWAPSPTDLPVTP